MEEILKIILFNFTLIWVLNAFWYVQQSCPSHFINAQSRFDVEIRMMQHVQKKTRTLVFNEMNDASIDSKSLIYR